MWRNHVISARNEFQIALAAIRKCILKRTTDNANHEYFTTSSRFTLQTLEYLKVRLFCRDDTNLYPKMRLIELLLSVWEQIFYDYKVIYFYTLKESRVQVRPVFLLLYFFDFFGPP